MSTAYPTNVPLQSQPFAGPNRASAAVVRGSSPLDWAFLLFTAMIPIEPAVQAGLELNFALGRLILPVMAVLLLLARARGSTFKLPPRLLWCVPWFVVAFIHIAVSGDWFPIYNYRTYVLNALCSVLVYNYAKSNKPSATAVLTALAFGVGVFAILCTAGIVEYGVRAGRLRIYELDENGVGGIFGLGAIAMMVLCIRKNYAMILKVGWAAAAVLCTWFTIGTGSRGAFAALVIAVFALAGYLAIYRKSTSFLIGVTAVMILGFTARAFYKESQVMQRRLDTTFDESASNRERFGYRDVIFVESCRLIAVKPFLGWGEKPAWDALGAQLRHGGTSGHMGTHNTYMQVLTTAGVGFGGMFLWFMLQPLLTARRFLSDPDYMALLIVMVHFYATSLTLDQIGYRFWWWVLPLILARQQELASRGLSSVSWRGTFRSRTRRREVQFAGSGAS